MYYIYDAYSAGEGKSEENSIVSENISQEDDSAGLEDETRDGHELRWWKMS